MKFRFGIGAVLLSLGFMLSPAGSLGQPARSGDDPAASFIAVDFAWTTDGDPSTNGSTVTIQAGQTVTFSYPAGNSEHNADFDNLSNGQPPAVPPICERTDGVTDSGAEPPLPSSAQPAPWSGQCTFTTPGVYNFHCDFHPFMVGEIDVVPAAASDTLSASVSPGSIVANGSSAATVTATVDNSGGSGVSGENVSFGSSDPGEKIGAVKDQGNGSYTATVTSSTTAGAATITATDSTQSPALTASTSLTQTAGPASSVAVALSPTSVAANGSSTSTATAMVTDAHGNAVTGDQLAFSSSDAGERVSATANHGNGSYSATITSSTTVGTPTITATDSSVSPSVSGHATLSQTAGPASSVAVALSPTSIVADGTSTSTATATVTDSSGHALTAETVAFSSSDPAEQISATANHGDGTYSATITSSTRAAAATITATDASASPSVVGQATLTQTPGPVSSVSVTLDPSMIVGNGATTSTVTATVADANGNGVADQQVVLSSSDPGQQIGAVTDDGGGRYTATVESSTEAGPATITATVGTVFGQATLTQTPNPGAPASVSVRVAPASIVADGTSTAQVTATVTDGGGNPVAGEHVVFSSSDPGEQIGAVADHGDGTYTATIVSSTTIGQPTITATDGALSGTASLTQTAGPASSVAVSVAPASIVADGSSSATATATVKDALGHPLSGQPLAFTSSDSGEHVGAVTDHGNGTYTATIVSSTTAGTVTIAAADGAVSGHTALTQTAPAQSGGSPTNPGNGSGGGSSSGSGSGSGGGGSTGGGSPPSGGQPPAASAPVPGTAHATVRSVTARSDVVKVSLTCPAAVGGCAAVSATLAVVEHLRKGRVTAVTARATTRSVVVGHASSGPLGAGRALTLSVSLNAAGRSLLARFHQLSSHVSVTSASTVLRAQGVRLVATRHKKGSAPR